MLVWLRGPGWVSPPVLVAHRRRARRRGVSPRTNGRGCLIRSPAVHTMGMRECLWVIPLDDAGRVLGRKLLGTRQFYHAKGAAWVLELPATWSPPAAGVLLELVPRPDH